MTHIFDSLVQLLIDSGSSHNFLQSRVAHELRLTTQSTKPLSVLVGNGETLICSKVAQKVVLHVQCHKFEVDFYLIDLSGSDVVLGVWWLQGLGLILTDYDKLTMQFTWTRPSGATFKKFEPTTNSGSVHQMKKLISSGLVMGLFSLSLTPDQKPTPTSPMLTNLQQLLETYTTLFDSPKDLPSPWP